MREKGDAYDAAHQRWIAFNKRLFERPAPLREDDLKTHRELRGEAECTRQE